jgi:glycosyltransferase involved in cell wall biosynthesis
MDKKFMKLLILTQKVDKNDDVLGFFHSWLLEFARQAEHITVICLQKGEYDVPENVEVLSLGKEAGVSPLMYVMRFYMYIWRYRNEYDVVFVHMNQIYVLLGGLFWRAFHKKIALWYAHGYTPFGLRIAEKLAHIIFTSTQSGFRLTSKKVLVIGQGIDTDTFKPEFVTTAHTIYTVVSVGRISPVKNYETLIDAVRILRDQGISLCVYIVGGVGLPEHQPYLTSLEKLVHSYGLKEVVTFVGPVPNKDIKGYLKGANIFVNTSLTGSLDKAVLEAMALEIPILTCNEAFLEVLPAMKESVIFKHKDSHELSRKIQSFMALDETNRAELTGKLRSIVVENHSVKNFVGKILHAFQSK